MRVLFDVCECRVYLGVCSEFVYVSVCVCVCVMCDVHVVVHVCACMVP